eukprot:m.814033 g.814033  ORF g.814033 m.814033 type:complete len:502 (+) comp23392_c0_seq6:104-1609(+)
MRDRHCCSDSRGSCWTRTGLILGTLTTIIFVVILVGYDFVISDELSNKEIAESLSRPESTDPFKSLGAVRSLNISFWGYCIGYDAPTYNNASVSVCFSFDEKFETGNSTITDGCTHFSKYDVCKSRDTAMVMIFISMFFLAIADIFSEKIPLQVICMGVAFVCGTIAVCVWTRVVYLFNKDDNGTPLKMAWGFGLSLALYGTMLSAVTAALLGLPYFLYDSMTCTQMWRDDLMRSTNRVDAPTDTGRQQTPMPMKQPKIRDRSTFVRDAVGVPGRMGAGCGFAAWVLLIVALFLPDWYEMSAPPSDSAYKDFSSITKATLGLDQYCLERIGVVSTAIVSPPRAVSTTFTTCFDYDDDDVTLLYTRDNATSPALQPSVVVRYGSACDVLSDADFCKKKNTIGVAIALAILAALIGDVYSDLTYANGLSLGITALFSTIAAVVFAQGKSAVNDGLEDDVSILDFGNAFTVLVASVAFSVIGTALCFLDFYLVGRQYYKGSFCC